MRINFSIFQRKTPKYIKTKIMADQKCWTTIAKANSLYTTIITIKSKIPEQNQEQSLMTCIIYPTTTTIPTIDRKNGVIDQAKIIIYQIEKLSILKLNRF
jgi:hypothetical protein